MKMLRRSLFTLMPAGFLATPAHAGDADPRGERSIGSKSAKSTVVEFFSFTCPHCARFAQETMPEVKRNLIDTGQVRWVFSDYPNGPVATIAAMVARYAPLERYEGFANALYATQRQWGNYDIVPADATRELWTVARTQGMSREVFDRATGDNALRDWIASRKDTDGRKYMIDYTPTFLIGGRKYAKLLSYEELRGALS